MLETWRLNIQLNLNEPFSTGFLNYDNGKYTCGDITLQKIEMHREQREPESLNFGFKTCSIDV